MPLALFLRTSRPRLYVFIISAVALVTVVYRLRVSSIFACPAEGYENDRYLESCSADNYGDYDHGAFFFGLEPGAEQSAREAEVLFLGNSREQFAFSTSAVDDWFSSRSIRYYLLGFSYHDGHMFAREVLSRVKPQAKFYVMNLDEFFAPYLSPSAEPLIKNRTAALERYESKRLWQWFHRRLCGQLPALCGDAYAVFRMQQTGSWIRTSGNFKSEAVSENPEVNQETIRRDVPLGIHFLNHLTARRECIVSTLAPTVKARRGAAEALAASLKVDFVSPSLDGLQTFDGSHLDEKSAERWSGAFLELVGPRVQECMSENTEFSGLELGTFQHKQPDMAAPR